MTPRCWVPARWGRVRGAQVWGCLGARCSCPQSEVPARPPGKSLAVVGVEGGERSRLGSNPSSPPANHTALLHHLPSVLPSAKGTDHNTCLEV